MFFKGLKKTSMSFSMAVLGVQGFDPRQNHIKEQVAPWFLSPVKPVSWWVSGFKRRGRIPIIKMVGIHRNPMTDAHGTRTGI